MSTTKKQHLVWRKYLAPWTDKPESTDGYIFTFLKKENKICPINLMGVGVDRYTYDISMINEYDKNVAISYFKKWLKSQTTVDIPIKINDSVEIYKKDFIENTFLHDIEEKGVKILGDLYNCKFPFNAPSINDQILNILELNLLFSMSGEPLITPNECLSLLSYADEHKDEKDERFEFFEFFAAQLLRTWRGQEAVIKSARETGEEFTDSPIGKTSEALFPIMLTINTFIFATCFVKKNYYIVLLKNKTSIDFVTGDNPIINLCANYEGEKELDKDEWYYPITPHLALICKNNIKSNAIKEITEERLVEDYNFKIAQAATKQVYASTKQQLEYLKELF